MLCTCTFDHGENTSQGTDQLEYTAPTGFRFLDEPMFCFSTLNANTNPNPNCRPGHRPWPLTPWQSLPGRRPWPLTPWQSLPGHRPWLLTAINRVSGQGRCPGRLCHGVSGHAGRLCHGVERPGSVPRPTVRVRVRHG